MEKKRKARAYTQARQAANQRYDQKTYKKINIALRMDDDADIIESIEESKRRGMSMREWLRSVMK